MSLEFSTTKKNNWTNNTRKTSIKCNDNRAKINVGFPKHFIPIVNTILFNRSTLDSKETIQLKAITGRKTITEYPCM